MGEKLLAQRLIRLLRDTRGRSSRTGLALLDWAADERDWLWPDIRFAEEGSRRGEKLNWERLPALAEAIDTDEPPPALFACVDATAGLLALDPFEAEVLRIVVAFERMPRLAGFGSRLFGTGENFVDLVGRLAGAEVDAGRRVRRSAPVALGLLSVGKGRHSGAAGQEIGTDWQFGEVLDGGLCDPDRLVDALAGVRQEPRLAPEDFAEQAEAFTLLERLLRGALARGADGVNVLIFGPPGTGKTEFARTLAAAAGATLYAVGEEVEGQEPTRSDRLAAVKRAQRLLARRGRCALLFDEMEDLVGSATLDRGGLDRGASKLFFNRLLENNRVPTIWTSNAIDAVDPAYLRRMSYILRIGYPRAGARARILARVAAEEGLAGASGALEQVLPAEESSAALARAALRGAALAGGGAEDAAAVGRSLLLGLRGGRSLPPNPEAAALDLSLYEADRPIEALVDRIAAPGAPADVSLLLVGPPGTGKTALAALVAERLGRPLAVKRTSDLLSSWVGETEARIAAAFAEARDQGAVLLFDEVDSLLFDRAEAQRSWEVSQVNELLTWMDGHKLPFIAATNHARRLDPAALRRFLFKLELKALSPPLAQRAWTRFFGGSAPAGLARISGLTPGDFALVARQLRYGGEASASEILARLEAEARAKPQATAPIGF